LAPKGWRNFEESLSMAKQDYYTTLGADRGASAEDLKKSYRKLAMQYHPDRNPGDAKAEAKFKEINEAYDVLKDDQKRAAYDRFGHAAFEQGGPGGGGFGGGGFAGGGLGDIFEQVFGDFMGGGGRGGARQRTGQDIHLKAEIELTDAFNGIELNLRVPTRVACEACGGSGAEAGKRGNDTCPTCGGAGKVRAQQGFFVVERGCPTCGGAGRVIRNPCKICGGQGTVQRERQLKVKVPAGVEDGQRIRLAGEGEAGPQGAPPGDLYVHIALRPHQIFARDGANLYFKLPIRMTQAALGAEVEVPVIDGSRARLKIAPGTRSGTTQRMRGKGFSVVRSAARGDMFVQIEVETPQNLTAKQRKLLEEFEAESPREHSPEHEGFFAKVREFFDSSAK
jgi:molecular chaperone DnaJ